MAEFSIEYVEKYMPDWNGDFSITEEADNLKPGEWEPIICEGYGFFGIHKNLDGDVLLLFDDKVDTNTNTYKGVLLKDLDTYYRNEQNKTAQI